MKISEKAALLWLPSKVGIRSDAFTAIYRQHHGSVRAVLFRFGIADDLEDLVQEVFLKAFRGQDAFRSDSSYKTWLLSIAINAAKDYLKKKRPPIADAVLESFAAPPHDPDFYPSIERALLSLELIYRELIILCSIEGYSMQEAAEILDIPEGTVKSRLATGRDKMRVALAETGMLL